MQSHLEAALLGHHSSINPSSNIDDDEGNFQEEDPEDVEDFIDEVSYCFLVHPSY